MSIRPTDEVFEGFLASVEELRNAGKLKPGRGKGRLCPACNSYTSHICYDTRKLELRYCRKCECIRQNRKRQRRGRRNYRTVRKRMSTE